MGAPPGRDRHEPPPGPDRQDEGDDAGGGTVEHRRLDLRRRREMPSSVLQQRCREARRPAPLLGQALLQIAPPGRKLAAMAREVEHRRATAFVNPGPQDGKGSRTAPDLVHRAAQNRPARVADGKINRVSEPVFRHRFAQVSAPDIASRPMVGHQPARCRMVSRGSGNPREPRRQIRATGDPAVVRGVQIARAVPFGQTEPRSGQRQGKRAATTGAARPVGHIVPRLRLRRLRRSRLGRAAWPALRCGLRRRCRRS